MKKIAVFGAGAFGQEVFLYIKDIYAALGHACDFIGFFDDNIAPGTSCKYGKVIGGMDDLNNFGEDLDIAIAIGNPGVVQSVSQRIINPQVSFPNYIHPSVNIMDEHSVAIGKGNIIACMGLLSFDLNIGDFNIFNTRCSVGHHVKIGSYNVFNPNIQLSGNVVIGDRNMFGLNAAVLPGKKVGNQNTLGAGAILTRHMTDDNVYIGNPATKFKF